MLRKPKHQSHIQSEHGLSVCILLDSAGGVFVYSTKFHFYLYVSLYNTSQTSFSEMYIHSSNDQAEEKTLFVPESSVVFLQITPDSAVVNIMIKQHRMI